MTETTNYKLPQWAAADEFSPTTQLNSAMEKIDTQMKANADAAEGGFGVVADVEKLKTDVATLQSNISSIQSELSIAESNITALQSRTYRMFGDGTVKYVPS